MYIYLRKENQNNWAVNSETLYILLCKIEKMSPHQIYGFPCLTNNQSWSKDGTIAVKGSHFLGGIMACRVFNEKQSDPECGIVSSHVIDSH